MDEEQLNRLKEGAARITAATPARPERRSLELVPPPVELWYPGRLNAIFATQGDYELGYPRGAVVHYTAGSSSLGAIDTARSHGFCYFIVNVYGGINQGAPLNRWGSHAGESYWPGLGHWVSRHLVGIEVVGPGMVTPYPGRASFKAWWGEEIPFGSVRMVNDPAHDSNRQATDNRAPGFYAAFTSKQESALTDLLLWLKRNNPAAFDFDLVLGHDEVSPGRKQDPGGSLSMSMPEFRGHLDREYRMRK